MHPSRFDLHRLRLLLELEHRGTLAAVAEHLNYSSASVSQQLALLQREVGVALIAPEGRGVRLTPQGRLLVSHVEAVFARLEEAEAQLAGAAEGVYGVVRVAAFQTAVLALLPAALTALRASHPNLRVEVIQAESEVSRSGLMPRDFDLIVDEVYPGNELARTSRLNQQVLFVDHLRLAAASNIGPRESLGDYADVSWVMEPPGSPARKWAVAACRAAGFDPDVQFESTDVVVHERLAASGHAVAFLPDLLPGVAGGVERHKVSQDHQRRIVATARGTETNHPAIAAVRDALRNGRPQPTSASAAATPWMSIGTRSRFQPQRSDP